MNEFWKYLRPALFGALCVALLVNVILALQVSQRVSGGGGFGELEVTLVTAPDCKDCFDLTPLRDYLSQNGVAAEQIKEVEYDSWKGKSLTRKYDITKVPTAVFTGDIGSYEFMQGLVDNIGETRKNAFVVTKVQPPYYDLAEDRLRGAFELIYLGDESCTECYDVNLHKGVFERMSLIPSKESTVDTSSDEGKTLVEEYFIVNVPTILLRGDLEVYESLQEIWPQVGTREQDGTYVLRAGVASMGTYKQLPNGEIIVPEPQPEI